MAEDNARESPTRQRSEVTDAALRIGEFILWDELTRNEIAAFEGALCSARDEHDMQRFLESHPRMLIQHLGEGRGAWVIPKKRLGSEHETDFMIAQKASGGLAWYAVELERPQARIFNKSGDPSAALTHALRQISDWRDWLSQNRDYAARPRAESGLGLIGIDPELEGLIIIGRNADVDRHATASRQRRLERTHRIRIETYDWLLSQANERLEILDKRIDPAPQFISTLLGSRSPIKLARKVTREVFGDTWTSWDNSSLVRGEIEWEGVEIWPDEPEFGDDVIAPLQIIYSEGIQVDRLLNVKDWKEWIDHVASNLHAEYSLLVSEIPPTESLEAILTLERHGTWYACDRLRGREEMWLSRLDIMVYLPPAISYDEKKDRVAAAREVFQRYVPHPAAERLKKLATERDAERKVISLSIAAGDTVTHETYGIGTVMSMSGSGSKADAIIDFGAEVGVRCIALAYAPLEKNRTGRTAHGNTTA
jgi:hypothetical protein